VVTVTLLDDLETVGKSSYECGISRILKKLPAKESQALSKAIDDLENSATSLARVLTKNGYPVSRQSALLKKYPRALNPALSTTQAVAFCVLYLDQQAMNQITLNY
jgi:hypothetical protein